MDAPYATQLLSNLAAVGATPQALCEHHLGPIAYKAGKHELKQEYVINSLLAEKRALLVAEVVDALTASGIPVALLKGVSYAGWLYDDPAERPMRDIDLLVPRQEHRAARNALVEIGFHERKRPHTRSRLHHAVSLCRGSDEIDLHRSIAQPVRTRIDLPRLWKDATPCEERDDAALRLAPIDEALFHFVNLARTQMHAPAITYLDGALLLTRLPDDGMTVLAERARMWGVYRATSAAIDMTRALTEPDHGSTRRGIRRRLLADPAEVLRYQLPPRPVQLLRKLILLDRPAQAAGFLLVALAARLPMLRD